MKTQTIINDEEDELSGFEINTTTSNSNSNSISQSLFSMEEEKKEKPKTPKKSVVKKVNENAIYLFS